MNKFVSKYFCKEVVLPGIRTEIEAENVADGAWPQQGDRILSEPSGNLVFIGIVTDCQKVVNLCSGMIGQNYYETIT